MFVRSYDDQEEGIRHFSSNARDQEGPQCVELLPCSAKASEELMMESQAITGWIDQLSDGNAQAAEQLWAHISSRLEQFALNKLDVQTRRHYDEHDAANSAFHSLCRGLTDGRITADNRDALWGLLAVITSRKISAQRRFLNRQKRGGGAVRGNSGFDVFGGAGINGIGSEQHTPDILAEVSESCAQLIDALADKSLQKIVLLKFRGATNDEVAKEMGCTRRTIERKLERVRRIWVEKGLHDPAPQNKDTR